MKAIVILRRGVFLSLLAVVLVATVGGCATPAGVSPDKAEGEAKRIVEIETEGLALHYLCQSFWGEATFSSYFANQAEFKSDFKRDFEQGLAKSDRPVSASGYQFSFDSAARSTVVRCDVCGAISKSGDVYHATFFWLLEPIGLDFIDDNFDESREGLFWEGSVKDIPTTVTVKLPTIDSLVYKAWEHPVGHCHAHVWWSD